MKMRTKFGIFVLAGAMAGFMLPTPPAEAQRDAGAKLRGDTGRYSGRPSTVRPTPRAVSPQQSYTAQPRVTPVQPQPAADPYEAYSLQPLPFRVGDDVSVHGEGQLMRGRRSLGSIPAGQQLRVLQIRGPWVGVVAEVDGREVGGWLWYSQVAAGDTAG